MSTNSTPSITLSPRTSTSTGSGVSKGLDGNFYNKTPLPYTIGATFTAHRHIPPLPFGHAYASAWPPFKTESFRLPQTAYCISRPPLSGHTLRESRTLTIRDSLPTGYSCGAQVIVVEGGMVARTYDPLYEDSFDAEGNKRDVVVLAEGDYAREAAPYEKLEGYARVGDGFRRTLVVGRLAWRLGFKGGCG